MFYEIRTEHARPGRGAELAGYMDETVIPLHQELGMHVVGAFTVIGDEDAFVWIRRFEDATDRERVLKAVHGDPRCSRRGRDRLRSDGRDRVHDPPGTRPRLRTPLTRRTPAPPNA